MPGKSKSKGKTETGSGKDHKRDQIAKAAIRIADAEGYQAVSMRRIATDLGMGTMTLYHYVSTKAELLSLMNNMIMSEVVVPEAEMPDDDWREAFEQIAHRSLETHLRHPWTFEAFKEEGVIGPNTLRHVEQSLQAARMAGLSGSAAFELILFVDDYVYGYVARAREDSSPHSGTKAERRRRIKAFAGQIEGQITPEEYPLFAEFMEQGLEAAVEQMSKMGSDQGRFERGLNLLLEGVERGLPGLTADRS
jgi:AcrR family transcriptional regulator